MKIKKKFTYGKLHKKLKFFFGLRLIISRLKKNETLNKKNLFLNFYFYNFLIKHYKNKNFFIFQNNFLNNYKKKFFIKLLFNLRDQYLHERVNFSKFLNLNTNSSILINKKVNFNNYYMLDNFFFKNLFGINYLIINKNNFLDLLSKNDEFSNNIVYTDINDNVYNCNDFMFYFNHNIYIFNMIEIYKILIFLQLNVIIKTN
jgi:hypothetical protein